MQTKTKKTNPKTKATNNKTKQILFFLLNNCKLNSILKIKTKKIKWKGTKAVKDSFSPNKKNNGKKKMKNNNIPTNPIKSKKIKTVHAYKHKRIVADC